MLKNKKGEMTIGVIIFLLVAVIVGITLLIPVFDTQAGMSNTYKHTNESVTLTTTGTALTGQDIVGSAVVVNVSSNATVPASNYSVYTTSTNGLKLYIKSVDPAYANKVVKVTYTYEPVGYNKDSGARGVSQLIPLFGALALLGAVIYYGMKEWDWL